MAHRNGSVGRGRGRSLAAAWAWALAAAIAPCGAYASEHLLDYATYFGGTGDDSEVVYRGDARVAVDAAGNAIVAGTTTSADFPTTPGAVAGPHGGLDFYVTKFAPNGAVLYSTVLGGPCDDSVRGVAVDAAGNAYVTGRLNGGASCYAGVRPGAFVAKLDPFGALVYLTRFGASLADGSSGRAIAVDAAGQAYVAGVTNSASHDFPTTPGAFRTVACANVLGFVGDGFVAKLDATGSQLLYSTLLCGAGDDAPAGIAIDAAGRAYVGGTTGSTDFPTASALLPTFPGGPVDVTGFVAALTPDGAHLIFSTYLGGDDSTSLYGLAVDGHGDVYVVGETASRAFPTTPGVLQEQPGNRLCIAALCTDAFVTKLAGDGTALRYSTYLGGELDDAATAIAVDAAGNATVAGVTVSSYFPMRAATQWSNHGLTDAFLATLDADGATLLRSTYLGGRKAGPSAATGGDVAWGVALDRTGHAWMSGYTVSYDFPVTANAVQPNLAAATCDVYGTPCGDAFVARLALDAPGDVPAIGLSATPSQVRPGARVTASWHGVPLPSAGDQLQLYPLGRGFGSAVDVAAWWRATGAAAGALDLILPAGLAAGTYELRFVGADPAVPLLPAVLARSEPIRVGGTVTTTVVTTTSTTAPGATTTTTLPSTCTTGATPLDCAVGGLLATARAGASGAAARAVIARLARAAVLAGTAAQRCAAGRSVPARHAYGAVVDLLGGVRRQLGRARVGAAFIDGLAERLAGAAAQASAVGRDLRDHLVCP